MRMTDTGVMIKICILSHPESLVTHLFSNLYDKFNGKSVYHDFSGLGVGITSIKYEINKRQVEIILVHTIGQILFNRLIPYYHGASGALIFFTRNNPSSFETARQFYQYFRKITSDSKIPVTFIDILDKPEEILIKDLEVLESNSNVGYYEIYSEYI
jgi:GTPase SAR1 family protein